MSGQEEQNNSANTSNTQMGGGGGGGGGGGEPEMAELLAMYKSLEAKFNASEAKLEATRRVLSQSIARENDSKEQGGRAQIGKGLLPILAVYLDGPSKGSEGGD